MEITTVIPPDDAPLEFEHLDCSLFGSEVNIIDDIELDLTAAVPTVELLGTDSKIRLFTDCERPMLAMHIKFIKRFMNMEIVVLDESHTERVFQLSNKTSFVTVTENICKAPIQVKDGWQYLLIDLEEIVANAFGTSYHKCVEVTISGSCRISKLYFQSKKYADIELPAFLRVVHG